MNSPKCVQPVKLHIDVAEIPKLSIAGAAQIPELLILNGKKLFLKIIDSEHVNIGKIIKINPGGLENSERNAKDGKVYFGKLNVLIIKFIISQNLKTILSFPRTRLYLNVILKSNSLRNNVVIN